MILMLRMTPPPQAPRISTAERPHGRLRFRLQLILLAAATVFVTAWLCTMGAVAAVLAIVVAKHILVALLLMGVGVDRERRIARIEP
jgi:hypothetical protein